MEIIHGLSTRSFNLRCYPGFGGMSALLALISMVAIAAVAAPDSVTLTDSQLHSIAVARVAERQFLVHREAIGNIGFNANASVQVFPPYQGRIIRAFVDLG